ncbi:glycosyltransferase, partial [bacterium]
MKSKYLFLMITTGIGGAERLQMDYFRHIDYDKHSVIFAVSNDVFSPYLEKEGLPVKVVKLPEIKYGEKFFKKFMSFYKFLREIRPDCVVINQFWLKSFRLSEFASAFLAAGGNVYMFVHDYPPVHPEFKPRAHFGIFPGFGLWWRKERLLQTLLAYFTKYTIAVSRATGEILRKSHRFPEKKIKIVYHGVDTDKFSPSAEGRAKFREDFNIPDSDKIIVSTARLDVIKRLDRLIEAFGILARERKDIRLILAGIGPEYGELTRIANSLDEDIKQRIKFLGFQENVAGILRAGDIFCLPSDSEGLP